MILRIRLMIRIPNNFLAEDNFAIDDRCSFPITAAQIKTNPATVQVPTKWRGGSAGGGNIFRDDNFESSLVNAVAHYVRVKLRSRSFLKMLLQFFTKHFRPIEIDAKSAPSPEQKFNDAFDIKKIF